MSFSRIFALTVSGTCLSFCCLGQPLVSQKLVDTFETHLKSSLTSYYKKYPREKVFVHTNQDAYSSGETIWYKIYAIAYGKPSALSGVIYVQLTDTAGNLLIQNKLPLVAGKAHGNIDIDPKLKSGWYKLSAFTSWMMNFDHESHFNQKIYIHNASGPASVTGEKEIIEKNYHIAFYPEGGDLVNGNLTRVAFKAFSEDGLPARIAGDVKDNSNKIIAKLITVHDGMGDFTIEPMVGNICSATVKFPDGSSQEVKLPAVEANGLALQADQGPNDVKIRIALVNPKERTENCLLAAFQNNGAVSTYPLQLVNGFNEFSIPKTGFSTGILRLTLFDNKDLPAAERILFINKHDLQASVLKADTVSFLPHGFNSFSMSVKDYTDHPVKGSFSVAVTDGDAFSDAIGQNIYSALLLSPELKGEVYSPGYYFKNGSDSLAQQLDLVMLTNGWRHFSLQKILNNENYAIKYPVERSSYIAGKVVDYKLPQNSEQLNVKLIIFNHDSTKFMGYAVPDNSGRFILRDFNHQGMSDVYLQTSDKKGRSKKFKVTLFGTLADSLKQAKGDHFPDQAFPDLTGYFISRAQAEASDRKFSNNIMLKTVNITAAKISPTEKVIEDHVNSKYTSDREFTLDLINNPLGVNISFVDYIRGRFTNLQILGDDANPQFIYRGGNTLGNTSKKGGPSADTDNQYMPYFYLNEARVGYDDINDIPLSEIALIRFMPPPVWFVPFNGGNEGAIMVYTKKQSDEIRDMRGISLDYDHYIYNGYSITREFSQPDYVKLKHSGLLDDRISLYWNHDIEPDANGILRFKFYNTDITKKFRITIQGMDNDGRPLYIQQNFPTK